MDMIGTSQSLIYCSTHAGQYKPGAVALVCLIIFAILANSVVIYFLVKVPLHPMAKTFMIMERMFSLLQCALIESLKAVFYYTTCQPNWSLLASLFNLDQELDHIFISLPKMHQSNSSMYGLLQSSIWILPTLNCSFLEKMSILFNTGCLLFFSMNCFLRFYLIVMNQANANRDCLTHRSEIVTCTAFGLVMTLLLLLLSMDDQHTFSRDCLAVNVKHPPPRLSKIVYNITLAVTNVIDLVLLIVMVITVIKAPAAAASTTRGGSKGSRHKKPVASALFQLLFSYLNISYVIHDYLEKVHDTTVSEALSFSLSAAVVHSYAPALILWSSTECVQALKSVIRRTVPCCKHSKGTDIPLLVMSERDKELVLAAKANEWRRKQQLNKNLQMTGAGTNGKPQPEMISRLSRLDTIDNHGPQKLQTKENDTQLSNTATGHSKPCATPDHCQGSQGVEMSKIEVLGYPDYKNDVSQECRIDVKEQGGSYSVTKMDTGENETECQQDLSKERLHVSKIPNHLMSRESVKVSMADSANIKQGFDNFTSDVTSCHLFIRPLSRIETIESVKQTMSSLKSRQGNMECDTANDAKHHEGELSDDEVFYENSLTQEIDVDTDKPTCMVDHSKENMDVNTRNDAKHRNSESSDDDVIFYHTLTKTCKTPNNCQGSQMSKNSVLQYTDDKNNVLQECRIEIKEYSSYNSTNMGDCEDCETKIESHQNRSKERLSVSKIPTRPMSRQSVDILMKNSGILKQGFDSFTSDVTSCHLFIRPLSRIETIESVKQTISSLKSRQDNMECVTPYDAKYFGDALSEDEVFFHNSLMQGTKTEGKPFSVDHSSKENMDDDLSDSNYIGATTEQSLSVPVTPIPKVQTVGNKEYNFESLSCTDCNKAFKNKSVLDEHLKVHKEKTFNCTKCDNKFKRFIDLKKHERIHNILTCAEGGLKKTEPQNHSGKIPFKWSDCDKKFKRWDVETKSSTEAQTNSESLRNLLRRSTRVSLMDRVDDPIHKIDAFKIEVEGVSES